MLIKNPVTRLQKNMAMGWRRNSANPSCIHCQPDRRGRVAACILVEACWFFGEIVDKILGEPGRSEEHTSELQSLMRISYAVLCLKKKNTKDSHHIAHDKAIKH